MNANTSSRAIIFRILMILYIFAVGYLCFNNFKDIPSDLPKMLFGIPIDKVAHFCMFFPFPIIYYLSFKTLARKPKKAVFWTLDTLVIGATFAAITELIQKTISYRSGDWNDFKADILALALACVVTLVLNLKNSLERAFK